MVKDNLDNITNVNDAKKYLELLSDELTPNNEVAIIDGANRIAKSFSLVLRPEQEDFHEKHTKNPPSLPDIKDYINDLINNL